MRAKLTFFGLLATLVLLVWGELALGATRTLTAGQIFDGLLHLVGLGDGATTDDTVILELRLWHALVAVGVGACLALSGGLLQGLFRNGLAAPSLIGVTGGASLGATLAILLLGGYGPNLIQLGGGPLVPYLVTIGAFVGAFGIVISVVALATRGVQLEGGGVSIATLLLVGVAINACIGGAIAAIQALIVADYEVARAVQHWTFGTLDDRKAYHAVLVFGGLIAGLGIVPFVATELDLLGGGEDDARTLGVSVARTRTLVLVAASLTAACAVSSAGQIAFVGLMVPHIVRALLGTSSYRAVLWVAPVAGAVLLLGTDFLQVVLFGSTRHLPPGVATSLLGGPFLLFLLMSAGKGRARA